MMGWTPVMPEGALALGGHQRVEPGGVPVLIARLEDGWHAVSDICLHRGASLAAGPLEGAGVTCHLHFWRFDVRTGACEQVPGMALKRFPTKVEDGTVYVEI